MTHSAGGAVGLHALLVEAEIGTTPQEGKLAIFIQFVSLTQYFHFWDSIYRHIYISMHILYRVTFYNTICNSKEWKQTEYPSAVDWYILAVGLFISLEFGSYSKSSEKTP